MSDENENLDLPIWGAAAIGREAGVFKKDKKTGRTVIDPDTGKPEVDVRKSFYKLETGGLPGTKSGNEWTSTLRLLRGVTEGAAEQAAARAVARRTAKETKTTPPRRRLRRA